MNHRGGTALLLVWHLAPSGPLENQLSNLSETANDLAGKYIPDGHTCSIAIKQIDFTSYVLTCDKPNFQACSCSSRKQKFTAATKVTWGAAKGLH